MKPRRSKVPLAPLYADADAPATVARSASSIPRTVSSQMMQRASDATNPGEFTRPIGFASPTAASPCGKWRAVADLAGLAVEERVVVQDHVTNSGTVVTLTRMDYSSVMRAYRVCRQSHIGAAANMPSLLKLFTVNDILLLALTFAIFLHTLVRGAGLAEAIALFVPLWSSERSAAIATGEPSSALAVVYARLALVVACPLILLCRLLLALRCVYVEEVLAVRGIGIQLTTYGIFNQVKSKEFVDLRLVRSIVIHDAFWRYQPIFTLTSSIENRGTRIVYFEHVLPRLEVLRPVLCGLRHILFEELEEGPSMSEIAATRRFVDANGGDSGAVSHDTDSTLFDSFAGMNASNEYEMPAEL